MGTVPIPQGATIGQSEQAPSGGVPIPQGAVIGQSNDQPQGTNFQAAPNEQTEEGYRAAVQQREAEHPILTAVGKGSGEVVNDVVDAVKGLPSSIWHSLPPVGAFDAIHNSIPAFKAYEESRAQGKGIIDSLSAANEVAKQRDAAHQALEQRINEFKKTPGQATVRSVGDAALFLASIYDGGKLNPMNVKVPAVEGVEGAAAETSVPKAAATAEKPGLIKRVINATDTEAAAQKSQPALQQGIRDVAGNVAKESGVAESTAKSIRDPLQETADNIFTKSKGLYKQIDQATDGAWQTNENALKAVKRGIQTATDDSTLDTLTQRKEELLAQQEKIFENATKNGVPQETVNAAKSTFKQASALEDVNAQVRMTAKGVRPELAETGATPESIDPKRLLPRINKLYDAGRLQEAVGEQNAKTLINNVDKAIRDGNTAITKAKLIGWGLKISGGAVGVGVLGEAAKTASDLAK